MVEARKPAGAGVFYPSERDELAHAVAELLERARPISSSSDGAGGPRVKAIVAPHAPYRTSGAVAAAAWKRVAPRAGQIGRIVVLGPAHHLPFAGVAAPFADAFETPLGKLPVDRLAIETARRHPQLAVSDVPHEQELSVEMQLPFAQVVLGGPAIVPLVVGEGGDEAAAEVMQMLWDDATLAVVSTDLSRYHDAATARRLDQATARAIESLDHDAIGEQQACGEAALRALLRAARSLGLSATSVEVCHSGDASGEQDEVVGFGAFAFA